jgi:hypothetical protein
MIIDSQMPSEDTKHFKVEEQCIMKSEEKYLLAVNGGSSSIKLFISTAI